VTGAGSSILTRTRHRLLPDKSRTVSRLFVPGQETLIPGDSRAKAVIDRVLAMTEDEVRRTLARTKASFAGRYRDLDRTLARNFGLVAHRLGAEVGVSAARQHLIGAYFTQQYALEGAALFNPSIVPHPDQTGCGPGELRFVMSLRAVGEGHLSSIEFRTGTISAGSAIRVEEPAPFPGTGHYRPGTCDRGVFQAKLAEFGHEGEDAQFLWSLLPARFGMAELDAAIGALSRQRATRGDAAALVDRVRWVAASSYEVVFNARHALSERVLWPGGPAESHGMEDARFVRFTDGAEPAYCATYTAFDGVAVASHLVETADFRTFTVSPLAGPATRNKGMALFPRRIAGRYAALSRWDRESNAIAYSSDRHRWGPAVTLHAPTRPWELIQLGNCGSPIETPAGWLAFTHGVGPMREYAIGAVLLDLDEPEHLISALPEPLLVADESERDGYVPNVVYSCGSLLHGGTVVLPYGCSDSSVRIATVELSQLLAELTGLGGKGGERVCQRGVNRESLVQAGDAQQLRELGAGGGQADDDAVRCGTALRTDQHRQPGDVAERYPGQVDDEQPHAGAEHAEQTLPQRRDGGDVKLALQRGGGAGGPAEDRQASLCRDPDGFPGGINRGHRLVLLPPGALIHPSSKRHPRS
jgi:predicted GH43/DUF377 family glycosyl hydrolase